MIHAENYPFVAKLDSIAACRFPAYSKVLYAETVPYSGVSVIGSQYHYEMELPFLKTARSNPPTIEGYDRYLAHMRELTAYLKDSLKLDYSHRLEEFELEIAERRAKLVRLQSKKKR